MTGSLEGRRAIITGASRGIGAGIAVRIAAEGADVVLAARTLDSHATLEGSLNETAERCRAFSGQVHTVVVDLSEAEDRVQLVPEATKLLGGAIDILVNNAAGAIYQPMIDYPLKRRRLMTELNLHAPVDLSQDVLPAMVARGEGWIVNLSSETAELPDGPPFVLTGVRGTYGFYGATKAALNRVTAAMAAEVHTTGVRINTVQPAKAVLSEGAEKLVGNILNEDQIESLEAMVEATLFLCMCGPDHTGNIESSLSLLEREGIAPMNLQGTALHPNGFRR